MKNLFHRSFGLLSASLIGLLLPAAIRAQPSFTFIGGYAEGVNYVWGVSNDGVVVGEGVTPDGQGRGLRWDRVTGVTFLQPLSGDTNAYAYAISQNGSTIVGESFGSEVHAVYWDASGNPINPGVQSSFSKFLAVSENGRVMAGYATSGGNPFTIGAIQFTQASGITDLGTLGGFPETIAFGAANDGTVIGVSALQAFRWTKSGGMEGLGVLPGTDYSFATAVSRNGNIVTGFSALQNVGNAQPYLWTKQSGMVGLGLPPGTTYAFPYSMTADGSTIVGETSFPEDMVGGGFIWTATDGMRSFTEVLTTDYGLGAEVEGLTEVIPRAISANGRYIVGMSTYGAWIFDRGQ